MVPVTGYASIGATASNEIVYDGEAYTGTVINTYGYFWVNGNRVLSGVSA